MYRFISILILFVAQSVSVFSQVDIKNTWVQSRLVSMSLDEKLGQLFMVAAYSNKGNDHISEIENLIINYHIGGLIFFQNDVLKQAYLTNYYQQISKNPLFIGIDGEWGLSMRLDKTVKFPYQITMGSLKDDSLVYKTGREIALHCKMLGIHINFAPVIDVNSNPNNPIINFRSFGENRINVAQKGWQYAKGMQDQNVLACAKHFPGHGDSESDSHLGLPTINKTRLGLDTLELYPFRYLIDHGVAGTMVAHLQIPSLDDRKNRASSLSYNVVTKLLKENLGFKGLVFTDALNMKGVSKYFKPGEVELEALLAGNDILLFAEDVPKAIELIKEAISNGKISIQEIDNRVAKILAWKQWAGLDNYKPIQTQKILESLKTANSDCILEEIAEQSLTLIKDDKKLLPVNLMAGKKVVSIAVGDRSHYTFQKNLKLYGKVKSYIVAKGSSTTTWQQIINESNAADVIIISLHDPKVWNTRTQGFSDIDIASIQKLCATKNVVVVGFCSPYFLKHFTKASTIIAGYEDNNFAEAKAVEIIAGKRSPIGILPVSIDSIYKVGTSLHKEIRKEHGFLRKIPLQNLGIDSTKLGKIDKIADELIQDKAAPGCQILVVKDGCIAYHKAFGHHTYDKKTPVKLTDLYDLASITKVAATTMAIMKLFDQGSIQLGKPLGTYWNVKQVQFTKMFWLTPEEIMTHRAGLPAFIPFYQSTLFLFYDTIYKSKKDAYHNTQVADNMYIADNYKDIIFNTILESKLGPKTYKYSDLGMMMLKEMVEYQTGTPFSSYLHNVYYNPMGLQFIGYKPSDRFEKNRIVPTQQDNLFRRQLVHGHVHDPGAAMLGGIAGHAGLFSNAEDLALLMQMLLNGGAMNGIRYLNPETIEKFTSYQPGAGRRGLGFDKPETASGGPASNLASKETFGHTGFTGTCVWADPKHNLVFVFLSNRIHPDENNKKLISGNYRTRIQDAIYESLIN